MIGGIWPGHVTSRPWRCWAVATRHGFLRQGLLRQGLLRHGAALALVAGICVAAQVVSPPPALAASSHPTTIADGFSHSCEIRSGNAYCWGDDVQGELGNNSTISSNVPVPVYTGGVLSGLTLTQIAAGDNYTCALTSAGAAYCWGFNSHGELGNNSTTSSDVPVTVSGSLTFTQLSVGNAAVCALTSAGAAYCWGDNADGGLGNSSTTDSHVPVAVTTSGTPISGVTLTQITAGVFFTCALGSAGAAYCWGLGTSGQLGNGTTTAAQDTAVAVTTSGTPISGVTLTQVTAGDVTACALSSAGAAYCWGDDTNGELGNGATTAAQKTAVAVTTSGVLSGVTLTQVSAGNDFTCALGSAGAAYCWGDDTNGELGNNSTTQSNVPVAVFTSGVLSGKTLTQIVAFNDTCVLDSAGTAYCWGYNGAGQAGNADTAVSFPVPVTVAAAQPVTIAAGTSHSCEIRVGTAYCWGDGTNGELGDNTTISSNVPVAASTGGALSGVTLTQITAGTNFTCALSTAGAAYCWGLGTNGQLGNGTTTSSSVPVAVTTSGALSGVTLTQITADGASACVLDSAGAAYCWGAGGSGQLGNGSSTAAQSTAVLVSGGLTLTQLTDGGAFTCGLDSAGAAYCWGAGGSGQLGNSTSTAAQSTPVAVTTSGALSGVALTQITAGGASACGLSSAGAAYCWGAGGSGQLGNGAMTAAQSTAVAVTTSGVLSGVTLTQITAGSNSVSALASTGSAYSWGAGAIGQLGNNSTTAAQSTAVAVTTAGVSGVTLSQISVGTTFACALTGTGAAYCWGEDGSAQIGNPATAVNFLVPTAVTSQAEMISAGSGDACLIRNGKAFCWGLNANGQLGNNSTTQSLVPVAVTTSGALSGVTLTQVAAGTGFTCALSSAGAAYCWGLNTNGQLGNNSTTQSLVPVAVTTSGALSGVALTQIGAGTSFACGLASTGTAYCWGLGTSGQLGNSATTSSSVPVTLPNGGVAGLQVAAGAAHGCALDNTGAGVCWGLNTNGQLGNGSTTSTDSPGLVTASGVLSGVNLTQIDGGNADTCAAAAGGAAYCWGINTNGELGNSSTTQSTTAVAVTTSGVLAGVSLSQIGAGGNSTCALDTTGAAYCWGINTNGELGNNSTTQSTAPVAVTTSGVLAGVALSQISVGQDFACALDTTGAAYCWGLDANGQLGNNSTTQSTVPVLVQGVVPGAPTGVTAAPGDTTATIAWTAPSSFGTGTLTGYTATATAASGTFTCSTTSARTCVITGLTDGTTYSVTVVTLTTDGNSVPSSPAVTVTPEGVLSLTSPSSLTWAVTGSGGNQSAVDAVSGDQQLTATDNTGSGAGWHVTFSATTFTTGPKSLPSTGAVNFTGSTSSSQASTAPTATCVGSCTLPTDTTTYPVIINTATSAPPVFTIFDTSAATGEGVMTIGGSTATHPIGWWVQVPASAYAGSYTSTVTLEVVSGP